MLRVSGAVALFAVAHGTANPVSKVVDLIKEMKTQVEAEGREDDKAYEKYSCWCKKTDGEKSDAIESAGNRIESQTAFVQEATAKEGQLNTEVDALEQDIEEDQTALQSALAIREKENEEFVATSEDMKETLAALANAIKVLESVNLAQTPMHKEDVEHAFVQVKASVHKHFPQFKEVLERDLYDVLGSLSSKNTLRGAALSQDPSVGGAAKGSKSYNSRSGAIFGILGAMNDQFKRDLADAEAAEKSAAAAFAKLKATKEEEIAVATEQIKNKKADLVQTVHELTMANKDISKLTKAKAADEDFLAHLRKDCTAEETNYADRVKIRGEEIIALGETISILTDDDARELFSKTTTLLQVSSTRSRTQRAMEHIAASARKHNNWALASLAVRVKLDAFEKVKETMDKMLADLKTQQAEEYDKKELCDKQIDEAEDTVKVEEQEKADLAAKHKQLTNGLSTLAADSKKLKDDVAASKVSLKAAGEDRNAENMLFQQTVNDQRATVTVLNKALARMKEFYSSGFVQINSHIPGMADTAAPPTPAGHTKNSGAGGVLQLLASIISETEQAEAEAVLSEKNSQADYAELVQDTSASLAADLSAIAEKEQMLADSEGAKAETESAQLANDEELTAAKKLLSAHHTECDWILKYFDVRQEARQAEMDSIEEAKAILSGAK